MRCNRLWWLVAAFLFVYAMRMGFSFSFVLKQKKKKQKEKFKAERLRGYCEKAVLVPWSQTRFVSLRSDKASRHRPSIPPLTPLRLGHSIICHCASLLAFCFWGFIRQCASLLALAFCYRFPCYCALLLVSGLELWLLAYFVFGDMLCFMIFFC